MKKFTIAVALIFNIAYGYFSLNETNANITAVNGDTLTLSNPIGQKGTTGVIVRYIDGKEFMLAYIKQISNSSAVIIDKDPIGGKHLANIKPYAKVGDRVIGKFLYKKAIVLAPNKEAFEHIESKFSISSQNPNFFLTYTKGSSPTAADYKNYAKLAAVGLFIIAKNGKIIIYDPISQTTIANDSYQVVNTKVMQPFYNNFN